MKINLARRGSDDPKWQKVKKQIALRDRDVDRILKVVSFQEALALKKNAPFAMLKKLDPAHIFPVSTHPHIMYDPDNLMQLNRYSHTNLDNCKDPITGDSITREERQAWWARLAQFDIQILEDRQVELLMAEDKPF